MEGHIRKRHLSEEEIDLWAYVTRHDTPLADAARRAPNAQVQRLASVPPVDWSSSTPSLRSSAQEAPARQTPHAKSARHHPEPFDLRIGKSIARGRRPIDARLDLHGLRQGEAYAALRRFLAHCQASNFRHVLVITGKGGEGDDSWNQEAFGSERGVLRRLLPQWLSGSACRPHVVSYTEAAQKHGGRGAFYVTIRKMPRRKHR